MKSFKTFLEAKYGLRSPISVKKGDILRKQRNEPLRKKHSDIGQDDTNIEKNVISKQLKRDIKKVLSKLTDREALVIRYRFGLDGEKEHTLDQIEKKLKVSRERIRQIETTALRKLRFVSKSKLLRPYIEKVSSSFMEAKKKSVKKTNIKELEKALKNHDWFYMYSDDSRAYNKGRDESDKIHKLIKDIGDEGKKLYKKYSKK